MFKGILFFNVAEIIICEKTRMFLEIFANIRDWYLAIVSRGSNTREVLRARLTDPHRRLICLVAMAKAKSASQVRFHHG